MADLDLDRLFGPEDDDEPANGPKALRNAFKKLQKELADTKAMLTAVTAEKQKSTLADLVKAKGLPEKVAALYTGEPTEEGLSAWLGEYGDVLGVKPADVTADDTTADAGMTPGIDPALVAAQQAMAGVASTAQAQTADHASQTRVRATKDQSELAAVLASNGITLI